MSTLQVYKKKIKTKSWNPVNFFFLQNIIDCKQKKHNLKWKRRKKLQKQHIDKKNKISICAVTTIMHYISYQ